MTFVSGTDRMHKFKRSVGHLIIRQHKQVVGNGYPAYHIHTSRGIALFYGHPIRWERKPTYHVHWLVALQRGAGRCALSLICDLADTHSIHLHLFPVPIVGGTHDITLEQLLNFYTSFGFYTGTSTKNIMEMWRKPL